LRELFAEQAIQTHAGPASANFRHSAPYPLSPATPPQHPRSRPACSRWAPVWRA